MIFQKEEKNLFVKLKEFFVLFSLEFNHKDLISEVNIFYFFEKKNSQKNLSKLNSIIHD